MQKDSTGILLYFDGFAGSGEIIKVTDDKMTLYYDNFISWFNVLLSWVTVCICPDPAKPSK